MIPKAVCVSASSAAVVAWVHSTACWNGRLHGLLGRSDAALWWLRRDDADLRDGGAPWWRERRGDAGAVAAPGWL